MKQEIKNFLIFLGYGLATWTLAFSLYDEYLSGLRFIWKLLLGAGIYGLVAYLSSKK